MRETDDEFIDRIHAQAAGRTPTVLTGPAHALVALDLLHLLQLAEDGMKARQAATPPRRRRRKSPPTPEVRNDNHPHVDH